MGGKQTKEEPKEQKQRNNQTAICKRKKKCCRKPIPSRDPLFFHPYCKGSQIKLDSSNQCAWRNAGFCNGITFTHRPVNLEEKVRVKITKMDVKWNGALRLGCTLFDPSLMVSSALPRFICPDLENVYGFWAKALQEDDIQEGTVITFWINIQGFFLYSINGGRVCLLMDGLLVAHPLWVMIDVYGRTQGIQIEDPCVKSVSPSKLPKQPSVTVRSNEPQTVHSQTPVLPAMPNNGHSECRPRFTEVLTNYNPQSSKPMDEDCLICFSYPVDSVIYKCGHMCLCYGCGKKLLSRKLACPVCREPMLEIIKTFPN
ncbi:E3 ubiquitin-protein ligase NEURL3-like [Hypanus sabinus]|uniref:E3 ubiquitin-protein ligase NEURL3-like n=1 Tax=Hypanus sabinus TaxID=79690 RepID=UPI0028C4B1BF|nr:E3 ubiquitin-protein ligase NEURL3-like [Hypanus sabinus]